MNELIARVMGRPGVVESGSLLQRAREGGRTRSAAKWAEAAAPLIGLDAVGIGLSHEERQEIAAEIGRRLRRAQRRAARRRQGS